MDLSKEIEKIIKPTKKSKKSMDTYGIEYNPIDMSYQVSSSSKRFTITDEMLYEMSGKYMSLDDWNEFVHTYKSKKR